MLTRRDFIRNAAAAIALPVYIPIERLDKIYIPRKKIIQVRIQANRPYGPFTSVGIDDNSTTDEILIGDVFTIDGVNSPGGEEMQFTVEARV